MALQWQAVVLPLLLAIIANCSSLPNDFSGDYHPQIWSVLDYLNSDPNRVYNYNFGYFVSARKQTENVNDIVLDVEAECVDRNQCSTTLLHCRGFVEYFSATDKYETLPGIRCQVKSQNDETRFPQGPTEESHVTDDKPNVPEEVIPSVKTPCLGCLMDVNKDAEGADEFLNIALKHIESERTRKHIVTNILRIQRQIVAGIKYVFLLEIAPTVCPSNVYLVNTELCPVDAQSTPEVCLVEFYEKPRLNSAKQIVSNNCTQSQSFALPKSSKPGNDFSNEIDVNGYKKEENAQNYDASAEPTDKGPNFDRIAASDNFEEIGLSPERLAALEAQIIPTDSTEDAKPKTALHVETTKSGIDNSQLGVEDIPSVQTSTDSFYHDKHERRPMMEAFAKLRRIHETLGSFKVKRDVQSNEESKDTSEENKDQTTNIMKRDVHSSEDSKDSSEETKDPTGGATRRKREAETDEDSNDTSEEAKNVRRKRDPQGNEDSKSSSEETKNQEAGNARRKREADTNEDSKSSSEETKNQEAGNARRKREADTNEDSKSSSEETKNQEAGNARRKREADTNEDSKSSSEEIKIQERGNARRKRGIDSTDESKSSEEAKTQNNKRKREAKSSEESKDSSEETTDQPGRKKRDAESSEESNDTEETGKTSIKRESEESLDEIIKAYSAVEKSESNETLDLEKKRKLRAVANDDDSSSSSSDEEDSDKGAKHHKKAHGDLKKEDVKKAELKDKADDSSSSSSDDKDEGTERIKRGAKDDSSSSSSSSSDDDDNDDNDDNNGNDKRKHKKASSQRKSKKNDKDDNDKDDDSSSSSSSSSSDDDKDNDIRKRRSIHDMVKPGSEEKLLVKKLANFAASSYDDANHRTEVLEILGVKKIELEGAVYHLWMKVGTSNCASVNSCVFEQEKLCKVQLHVSKDQKIRLLKSHCHNIGKNANENRTNRSKRQVPGGVVTAAPDETILGYVDSTLLQLDSKSSHENKYKLVEVLKSTKQVVSGMLYKIKAKLVLSDCSKNDPKHSKDCGELKDAVPKVCDIVIWDQPWLQNGKQTNVTCEEESYQFLAKRSVNSLGRDEHHNHLGLFKNFMSVHNKTYSNDEEMRKRFRIFRDNMKTIELLTRTEQGTAVYGATKFADLTSEEFKQYKGYRPELRSENEMKFADAEIPDIELPTEFDWRKKGAVTEVKDQGSCGSCWAFSVTGNVEGQYAIKHGELLEFSEQELVDCDTTDNGCGGGLMDNAYRAIEKLGGLEQEKAYPYDARNEKCHFKKELAKVQLSGALNISQDETDMAKWLTKNGPISIAINANAMQFYVGGVSHPLKFLCSPKSLDHGVLIVGYGVHKYPLFKKQLPYWIVKNSWSRSWGEQGYYRVYRGDGTCGLNQTPSSAIVV